jgi:hypothetical protein
MMAQIEAAFLADVLAHPEDDCLKWAREERDSA